jgi:glycosyltransferase involved in cell wall biosynthesis
MEIMARAGTVGRVALSVAGPAQDPEYLAGLQRSLHASPLREHVRFLGQVPWERMPELYQDHEVYLLPSVFEEPFSIGLLEAMASGLAVVGTTTGGSREVLVEGENSLTFPAEDAPALAAQLQRVLDPTLRARLAAAGRRTVEQRFPLDRILSEIETFLQDAVAQHRAGRRGGGM